MYLEKNPVENRAGVGVGAYHHKSGVSRNAEQCKEKGDETKIEGRKERT